MAIIVERVQRYQKVGDKTSPQLYYLKRKAKNSRLYDTKRIAPVSYTHLRAHETPEQLGGMSAEDVEHVVTALVRNIKRKLTDGDSVKLDGLGVFYTTFHSKGTVKSEDSTVKNIDKVNIRFLTDSGLRLVNDSGATTKGGPNNVAFELYNPKEDGSSGGNGGGGGNDGEEENPLG